MAENGKNFDVSNVRDALSAFSRLISATHKNVFDKIFDLTFLCHLLGTPQMLNQYRSLAAGSTVNNLNKELVGNTVVTIPKIDEQRVIGQYLDHLDHLITLHQRELENCKNQEIDVGKDVCLGRSCEKMKKITLYHGTPDRIVTPKFGGGDDKHDYGRGFYLTENIELAKEWAVCRPNEKNGWVTSTNWSDGLKILDFQEKCSRMAG